MVKIKRLGAADLCAASGLQFCVFGRGQSVKVSPGHWSIMSVMDLTEMWRNTADSISGPCKTQNQIWLQRDDDDEVASSKNTPVLLLW